MGLLPLVVDKLRQDSKLHDANMSKSTFGTKNVPAYSQFMFQYVYYCKQVYFQQEQSKLSGEIAFFSNLRKRGFQSGLIEKIIKRQCYFADRHFFTAGLRTGSQLLFKLVNL